MRNQQTHAEHRVEHVYLHAQRNAQCAKHASTPAIEQAVARDHGEIRPGADDGQDGDDGNGKEFGHVRRSKESGDAPILGEWDVAENRFMMLYFGEKN